MENWCVNCYETMLIETVCSLAICFFMVAGVALKENILVVMFVSCLADWLLWARTELQD